MPVVARPDYPTAERRSSAKTGSYDKELDWSQHGAVVNQAAEDEKEAAECGKGYAEICRVLLAAGAEVDAREIDGRTPFYLAALLGHVEVVNLLLEAKASVTVKDDKGRTPLDDARRKGHDEVVKILENAA